MEDRTDEQLRKAARRGERRVDGDLEVARRYIEQLQSQAAEEAIPRLVEILEDESWYLRDRAGAALAGYGIEAAPAVERLLDGGLWYTRAAALRVLGRIAAPRSLPRVVAFMRDGNQTIAEEAARAVLLFCRQDRALAAAKLLHAVGIGGREAALSLMRRIDPDGSARLQRLVTAPGLMGAEGQLTDREEERLVLEISDRAWGIAWDSLVASEPLPQPERDILGHLREEIAG